MNDGAPCIQLRLRRKKGVGNDFAGADHIDDLVDDVLQFRA